MTVLQDLHDAISALNDARRVIICPPDLEQDVLNEISKSATPALFTVQVSRVCPEDQVFVLPMTRMTELLMEADPAMSTEDVDHCACGPDETEKDCE